MTCPTTTTSLVESEEVIFIFYSRKDLAFLDRLEGALRTRGSSAPIYRHELGNTEEWQRRIETPIGRAEAIVVVLSPDAVESDLAHEKVAFASLLNKRLIPIVCTRVNDGAVPDALRWLNCIYFDDPLQFEASSDRLHELLHPDPWLEERVQCDSKQIGN